MTTVRTDPAAAAGGDPPYGAPSLLLRALEWRAGLEYGAMLAASPLLRLAPRGDGHPVLVLPGFGADDRSTVPLRGFLRRLGYAASGWGLGVNLGPTERVLDRLPSSLARLGDAHGGPVSLLGWSLGGIFAREMARHSPERVRQVITLGAPFNLVQRRDSHANRLYEALSRYHSPRLADRTPNEFELGPLPVPATSIYSRSDGVVPWQACLQEPDERHENVEVWASHVGLGVNPVVLLVVADRLAQAPGTWRPYRPVRALARFLPPARPAPR